MKKSAGKELNAPWEKTFDRVLGPLDEFIHRQTTSGVLLMACALVALYIANSQWNDAYQRLLQLPFTVGMEGFGLSKSLHHWINDGLMAMFFFVIGLELKRELLVGELADPKQAILPIIAACGGMLVPVLVYVAFNPQGSALAGWGVPMATDIAFALGALALLGKRVPRSLLTFLVALAIVDDLEGRTGDSLVLHQHYKFCCSGYRRRHIAGVGQFKPWGHTPSVALPVAGYSTLDSDIKKRCACDRRRHCAGVYYPDASQVRSGALPGADQ